MKKIILFLALLLASVKAQTPTLSTLQEIQLMKNEFCSVIEVNASWNWNNRIPLEKLENCYTAYVDLSNKNIGSLLQKEWNINVVPTVIIFKNGIEVERFEANLTMKFSEEEILQKVRNAIRN